MDDVFRKEQYMSVMHDYMVQMSPKITAYLFGLAAGYKRQACEQHRQELVEALQKAQVFPGAALPSFDSAIAGEIASGSGSGDGNTGAYSETHWLAMVRLVHYIHEHREAISHQIDLLQTVFSSSKPPQQSISTKDATSPEMAEEYKEAPVNTGVSSTTAVAVTSEEDVEVLADSVGGLSLSDMIELTGLHEDDDEHIVFAANPTAVVAEEPSGPNIQNEISAPAADHQVASAKANGIESVSSLELAETLLSPSSSSSSFPGSADAAGLSPQAQVASHSSVEKPTRRKDTLGELQHSAEDAIDPRELLRLYLALVEQTNARLPT